MTHVKSAVHARIVSSSFTLQSYEIILYYASIRAIIFTRSVKPVGAERQKRGKAESGHLILRKIHNRLSLTTNYRDYYLTTNYTNYTNYIYILINNGLNGLHGLYVPQKWQKWQKWICKAK